MKKNILFAVAAMLLMALSFSSCGGNTPGDVAVAALEAIKDGDVEKAVGYMDLPEDRVEYMVEKLTRQYERDNADNYLIKNGKFEVLSEDINGDEADVEVSIMADGYGTTRPFYMRKVNGTWKIASK